MANRLTPRGPTAEEAEEIRVAWAEADQNEADLDEEMQRAIMGLADARRAPAGEATGVWFVAAAMLK